MMKKKLIEVALPLEAINREAAREKSIQHGHPSTLRLWCAETVPQPLPVPRVGQDRGELGHDPVAVSRQCVLEPVKRLYDTHRRPAQYSLLGAVGLKAIVSLSSLIDRRRASVWITTPARCFRNMYTNFGQTPTRGAFRVGGAARVASGCRRDHQAASCDAVSEPLR
jgi:hypothetical protein